VKLSDAQENYEYFSGKASEVARQLSLAGVAVIWVFRGESKGGVGIPNGLIVSGLCFCLALAFDLLHYVAGTIAWGTFHRFHETRLASHAKDPVLTAPPFINWTQTTLFILKLAAVGYGYVLVLRFLIGLT
jgi:hypothetical protein